MTTGSESGETRRSSSPGRARRRGTDHAAPTPTAPPAVTRFEPALLYEAARMYYLQDATQAEIASRLGTSRPTVSRLLAEARSTGIVQVTVRNPTLSETAELEQQLVEQLGLKGAHVVPTSRDSNPGRLLAPAVSAALSAAQLNAGDALLVSSGATVNAVAHERLPLLEGVVLCPTVGGVDEPEPHYQTNEITRALAVKVRGIPVLLHAPAMPTAALHAVLMHDPQVQRIMYYWRNAKAALLGIGGPPHHRRSLPGVISLSISALPMAVGDICARPYDRDGTPIEFPGSDRLIAMTLNDLRGIPHTIGAAIGIQKLNSIHVAIRAGYINTLATDTATAEQLLAGS